MTIRSGSLLIEFGWFGWTWLPGQIAVGPVRVHWARGSMWDEFLALAERLRDARWGRRP